MNSIDTLNAMDPAALALAEIRARERGMTLSEWLEAMVYEHAARPATRRHHWYGGGAPSAVETSSRSHALATSVWSRSHYDLDSVACFPLSRPWPMLSTNFDHLWSHSTADEATSSALRSIIAFPPRISHAAILLSAAFAEAQVRDFRLPHHRLSRPNRGEDPWYSSLVDTCLQSAREIRRALIHEWTPTERAERLWRDAFATLSELSPAQHELLRLFNQDRSKASVELARHLDLATQQFELSAKLLAAFEDSEPIDTDEQRFATLRASLLERAGGGLSLTDGAKLLGVTRQALHKRIKAGTALGMMNGEELVLPKLQWDTTDKRVRFVPGLADIVKTFGEAGGWSALQFLLENNPNLGRPPIDALRGGDIEPAVAAARAYLGLDEG